MKKIWTPLTVWMTATSLYALPLGNPWEASLHTDGIFCTRECPISCNPCPTWCDAWSLRLGFYGDFVFNRHVEVAFSGAIIQQFELSTQAGYLALNIWDRIDVFTTLGATQISLSSPIFAFSPGPDFIGDNLESHLSTEYAFSWSLGVRGTLWECGALGIGAEGQYFTTHPEINQYFYDDIINGYGAAGDILKYQEWQIGLGAAYRISIIDDATALVPYAGVRWGRVWIDSNNFTFYPSLDYGTLFNMENQQDWGYAIGVTLIGCHKISATAEARFASENALYINTQFRF